MNYVPACNARYAPSTSWKAAVENMLDEVFHAPAVSAQARYDVYTDKQNYYVDIELPGVKKNNVEVKVEGDRVQVKATYTEVESQFLFIRRERPVNTFEQSFRVGENLDTSKLEAKFEDGLLRLTLPVKPEAAGRSIDVK